jgi:hypothetical protein
MAIVLPLSKLPSDHPKHPYTEFNIRHSDYRMVSAGNFNARGARIAAPVHLDLLRLEKPGWKSTRDLTDIEEPDNEHAG